MQSNIATDIFNNINADFTHIYSESRNKNCLVISDSFSNLVLLRACGKPCTEELIKGLIDWFSRYGLCRTLHIDAGPQSKCRELQNFLEKLGVKLIVSPSNAHHCSGRVESMVKRTVTALRYLIDNKKVRLANWHKLLPVVEFNLNKTPGLATKLSAHQICFGKNLEDPATLKSVLPSSKSLKERIEMLELIRDQANKLQAKAQQTYKGKYDKNKQDVHFEKGQAVFVYMERKATKSNPLKFQPKYKIGIIKKRVSKLVYLIGFKGNNKRVWYRSTHVLHMKKKPKRPECLKNTTNEVFSVTLDSKALPLFPLST